MEQTLKEQKDSARHWAKDAISTMTELQKQQESKEACQNLTTLEQFKKAQWVLSYCSIKNELNVDSLTDRILKENKNLALPLVTGESTMEFRRISGDLPVNEQLVQGSFGIREPAQNLKIFKPETPVMVVVPGLAFTKQGHRLGRGKGFYDRYLKKLKEECSALNLQLFICGICFNCQILNSLPCDMNDITMDAVVTPDGIFYSPPGSNF